MHGANAVHQQLAAVGRTRTRGGGRTRTISRRPSARPDRLVDVEQAGRRPSKRLPGPSGSPTLDSRRAGAQRAAHRPSVSPGARGRAASSTRVRPGGRSPRAAPARAAAPEPQSRVEPAVPVAIAEHTGRQRGARPPCGRRSARLLGRSRRLVAPGAPERDQHEDARAARPPTSPNTANCALAQRSGGAVCGSSASRVRAMYADCRRAEPRAGRWSLPPGPPAGTAFALPRSVSCPRPTHRHRPARAPRRARRDLPASRPRQAPRRQRRPAGLRSDGHPAPDVMAPFVRGRDRRQHPLILGPLTPLARASPSRSTCSSPASRPTRARASSSQDGGYALVLLLGAGCLALALAGAGRFSADATIGIARRVPGYPGGERRSLA